MARIDESHTKNNSRRKEVSRQIILICISAMDCGIANLEIGYLKPDSVGFGGHSRILEMDLQWVLVGLSSGIGFSCDETNQP